MQDFFNTILEGTVRIPPPQKNFPKIFGRESRGEPVKFPTII